MNKVTTLAVLIGAFLIPNLCCATLIVFTEAEDSHIEWTSGILQHHDNYGSSSTIHTANNGIFDTYGMIKFGDIFGPGANQISTDTIITSGELHLWMSRESDSFPNTINLYQLTKNWDENTVTGSKYGGLHSNTTGAAIDVYSKAADDYAELPQELVFDVTASLLDWQSAGGVTNYGWGIESAKLHAVNYFYSNESANSYTPYLLVNYDTTPTPEPATALLFGAGVAGLAAIGRRRKS